MLGELQRCISIFFVLFLTFGWTEAGVAAVTSFGVDFLQNPELAIQIMTVGKLIAFKYQTAGPQKEESKPTVRTSMPMPKLE